MNVIWLERPAVAALIWTAILLMTTAVVWLRRRRVTALLGNELARTIDNDPKWPSVVFFVIAIMRMGDAALDLSEGRLSHAIVEACFCGNWVLLGVLYRKSVRGMRICSGGVDLGLLPWTWQEIRSWNWSLDRAAVEFWTDSPWRWVHNPIPGRPIRHKSAYAEDVDRVLAGLAPRTAGD